MMGAAGVIEELKARGGGDEYAESEGGGNYTI